MASNIFIEKMAKVNRPKARDVKQVLMPSNLALHEVVDYVNQWLNDNPNVYIFDIQYTWHWVDGILIPNGITPANTNIYQTIYHNAIITYTLNQE